jgi:hypothetical protein
MSSTFRTVSVVKGKPNRELHERNYAWFVACMLYAGDTVFADKLPWQKPTCWYQQNIRESPKTMVVASSAERNCKSKYTLGTFSRLIWVACIAFGSCGITSAFAQQPIIKLAQRPDSSKVRQASAEMKPAKLQSEAVQAAIEHHPQTLTVEKTSSAQKIIRGYLSDASSEKAIVKLAEAPAKPTGMAPAPTANRTVTDRQPTNSASINTAVPANAAQKLASQNTATQNTATQNPASQTPAAQVEPIDESQIVRIAIRPIRDERANPFPIATSPAEVSNSLVQAASEQRSLSSTQRSISDAQQRLANVKGPAKQQEIERDPNEFARSIAERFAQHAARSRSEQISEASNATEPTISISRPTKPLISIEHPSSPSSPVVEPIADPDTFLLEAKRPLFIQSFDQRRRDFMRQLNRQNQGQMIAYRTYPQDEAEGDDPRKEKYEKDKDYTDDAFEFSIAKVSDPIGATPLSKVALRNDQGQLLKSADLPPNASEIETGPDYYNPATLAELTDGNYASRAFGWTAPNFYHKPLYFEEINLERYGQHRPIFQSAISAAHFFGTIPILPYKMGACPPNDCEFTYGMYRPGDCNPNNRHRLPLSLQGLLLQGAATTGLVYAIP